jgi:hypothetical protein
VSEATALQGADAAFGDTELPEANSHLKILTPNSFLRGFFFFPTVVGTELRTLCLLGRHSRFLLFAQAGLACNSILGFLLYLG